ncbi:MAG: protelomerase family protein [Ktedonobacteraceae bacterium]
MAELKWVEVHVKTVFFPSLKKAQTEEEVKKLCEDEMAFWKSRGLVQNSLRNPHSQSRGLVKKSTELSEQVKEWTLTHLNFGEEVWIEINRTAPVRLAERLESQMLLQDPDRILLQAQALLQASRWQDLAAGLAAVTGRRSTEILQTAELRPKSAYSVLFDGQLKTHANEIKTFEIPTLVPAAQVLDAFARLRAALPTDGKTAHEVSNAFHRGVTTSVKRHFEHLIPARPGESISTQTLRAVYMRLAIFFYCPVVIDAEAFVAYISGHRFWNGGDEHRSHAAGPHYSDYKMADGNGNIDGRQGLRLGQDGVEALEEFAKSQNGARPVSAPPRPLVAKDGALLPESLYAGEMLQLIKDGMAAANITDFPAYMTMAFKRQARSDLGIARRDTVADISEMSMEDLTGKRKHSTAVERIRRGVAALAAYNETHSQMERWFINATLLSYLIGGRFEVILDYLKEHKEEIDNLNGKYDLIEKYNRKPMNVKADIKTIVLVE